MLVFPNNSDNDGIKLDLGVHTRSRSSIESKTSFFVCVCMSLRMVLCTGMLSASEGMSYASVVGLHLTPISNMRGCVVMRDHIAFIVFVVLSGRSMHIFYRPSEQGC